jgi:hypothetical protein
MQTHFMTLKTLALSAIFSAILLDVGGTARASNGSGYGGPDLSPVAIPIAADQGLKLSQVARAYQRCLVDGTSGFTSIVRRFVRTLYGKPTLAVEVVQDFEYGLGYTHADRVTAVYVDVRCDVESPTLVKCRGGALAADWSGSGSLTLDIASDGTVPNVTLRTSLPTISVSKSTEEKIVNDWGQVVETNIRLFQPTIEHPKTPGVVTSEGEAKIKFPYDSVVSCLQVELQKAAQ